MNKFLLNHLYRCTHSNQNFVLLRTDGRFGNGSYLPVNAITGTEINDRVFDKEKHQSHFLTCPECQKNWNTVREQLRKQDRDEEFKASKAACQ